MMNKSKTDKDAYLWLATSKIPGRLERKRVREELDDHIDRLALDLMAQGIEEDEAFVRAVGQMGDAEELARSLGKVHPYDTAGAYRRMVELLWISALFSVLRIGPEVFYRPFCAVMQCLFLFALFRLRKLHPALKKGFLWAVVCFALAYLGNAANALMWETTRNLLGNLLFLLVPVAHVAMAWYLMKGLGALAAGGSALLKAGFGIHAAIYAVFEAASIVWIETHGLYQAPLEKESFDLSPGLMMAVFFVILAAVFLFCLRIRSALIRNEEAGIGPCKKRSACLLTGFMVVMILLPVAASALTAFLPVKAAKLQYAVDKEDVQVREALCTRLLESAEYETDKEAVSRLMEILPKKEVLALLETDQAWVQACENEENNSVLLVSLKADKEKTGTYRCHIGSLTELQAPFGGYAAAGSLWVNPKQDMNRGDHAADAAEKAYTPSGQWFFYQKGNELYEFAPRSCRDTGTAEMSAAEFSLPQSADRIYCYQTVEIEAPGPVADIYPWLNVGHEIGIQKTPVRLPYEQVTFDPSAPSWLSMTAMPLSEGRQRIVFNRGTVSHEESFGWKQDGYWHDIYFPPEKEAE